ncbi:MotE family protein [Halobacillus sp. A5]|uniref:MotE family protein n=1 Tax=Halobacillus sp. A5 TaxID=2880263 RepID=UPI0020A61F7A|nr:hypothetical protein [Halobacillus sp. A5]MCP3026120.1 hypothetical protein [Halobacillus sp. A5]
MAKQKKSKKTPIQSFFMIIVVPVVFTLTLVIVVLLFMGINVFEKAENTASQIPVVSEWFPTSEEENVQGSTERLEATIAENNSEIEQLEADNSDKESTIEELNHTIENLEYDLEPSAEEKDNEDSDQTEDMARAFQEMDEEEAAPIIENMDETIAIALLERIQSDQRGAILGVMDAETAAELTSLMTDSY